MLCVICSNCTMLVVISPQAVSMYSPFQHTWVMTNIYSYIVGLCHAFWPTSVFGRGTTPGDSVEQNKRQGDKQISTSKFSGTVLYYLLTAHERPKCLQETTKRINIQNTDRTDNLMATYIAEWGYSLQEWSFAYRCQRSRENSFIRNIDTHLSNYTTSHSTKHVIWMLYSLPR
jgi:hypothetical protein